MINLLVKLFVISIFFVSTWRFKVFGLQYAAVTGIILIGYVILSSLWKRGGVSFVRHKGQGALLLLLIWAIIVYLTSLVDPARALPSEVSSWLWTEGVNSPTLRGGFFLIRLFVAMATIEILVMYLNTRERFFGVLNFALFLYGVYVLFGFIQITLFGLFDVQVGDIRPPRMAGYFGVAGLAGETGTFAGVLVSAYFILFAVTVRRYREIWFRPFTLKVMLLVASAVLLMTFSAAWIVGVLATFGLLSFKYINRKQLFIVMVIGGGVVLFFGDIFYKVILVRIFVESTQFSVRSLTWYGGIKLFVEYPFAGVGLGNSAFFLPLKMAEGDTSELGSLTIFLLSEVPNVKFVPMNTWIQLLCELGVIGMILILAFIISLLLMRKQTVNPHYRHLVNFGFGATLIAIGIASHAGPDNFYVGYVLFNIALYIAGHRLFKDSPIGYPVPPSVPRKG